MVMIDKENLKVNIIKRLGISGEEYLLPAEKAIWDVIEEEPPVQIEPLTDREQRIFLAAMTREKVVCEEVDHQLSYAREPYEDTLVSVCNEVKRKVKAALWMN